MQNGVNIRSHTFRSFYSLLTAVVVYLISSGFVYSDSPGIYNTDSVPGNILPKGDSPAVKDHIATTDDIYLQIILKAEQSEKYGRKQEALDFYRKASEMNPLDDLPVKRMEAIRAEMVPRRSNLFMPHTDFERSSSLIQALVLVTIYSSVSMIFLLVFILFHRNYMQRELVVRQDLKERYQLLLMNYLFEDGETTEVPVKINKIAANNFKRILLVEEMKDLIVNLSGDAADKLRGLYYKLNLDIDSKRKAYSNKWHIKIKGFRELAFMNAKDANEEIIRCLQSNNSILRMEAQLALVRLNDDDRFSFLDHLTRPFTRWEQLNVHEMIVSHNLDVPDFQRWLDSPNRTVVLFSLNMIKVFKQKDSWEKIIYLLGSDDEEIRKTSIFVLGSLRIRQSVSNLKHHYKYEVYENMLEILIALGRIADDSAIKFLVMVIDKEDDVQLQIDAARALRDTGENGQRALEKLMHSDYKNYQIIIKHVLDKRI